MTPVTYTGIFIQAVQNLLTCKEVHEGSCTHADVRKPVWQTQFSIFDNQVSKAVTSSTFFTRTTTIDWDLFVGEWRVGSGNSWALQISSDKIIFLLKLAHLSCLPIILF